MIRELFLPDSIRGYYLFQKGLLALMLVKLMCVQRKSMCEDLQLLLKNILICL